MPVWNEENSSLKKNAFVGIPKAGSTTIGRYMKKYSDHIPTDTALHSDLKNMFEFKDYFISISNFTIFIFLQFKLIK